MFGISALLKDNSGVTGIEYALIAAGVSTTLIAVFNRVGTAIAVKLLMSGLIFTEAVPGQ